MNAIPRLPRSLSLPLALAAAIAGLALACARADAYIYWTDLGGFGTGDIGRADLDYGHADRGFIKGGIGPSGIAVDSKHVYWLNYDGDAIGRARLDGRKVDHHFVDGIGFALDIEVDGGYVYWSHGAIFDAHAGIGRVTTSGKQYELNYIDFGDQADYRTPAGLDVENGFVYWANAYPAYTIGRAAIDGSGVDQTFIADPELRNPFGLAVTETHIYIGNRRRHDIARAAIDGSALELEFIPDVGRIGTIAADERFIYWPGRRYSLQRARLDGSRIKTLSEHRFYGDSIAVDGLGPR